MQSLHLVSEYQSEVIVPAIDKLMEEQGIAALLHEGMKIVIKPNLVAAKEPKYPVTTHPLIVRAVAEWLRKHGITDITLAESSGGLYTPEHMNSVYKVCGMKDLEDVLTLNQDFSAETVQCPDGYRNHTFHLLTPIVHADLIINICKLKTHAMTGYSGGIKNLFGCIPGLEKPQMHYLFPDLKDFSNMLVELSSVVAPTLTIIDAIDCMEGNGPTGGTSHPLHMILGNRNFYEQDYFAAGLMGLEPFSIEMIRRSKELGFFDETKLQLVGDAVPSVLTPFVIPDAKSIDFASVLPKWLQKPFLFFASRILKSYPALNPEKCVGCGKCAESCPAHIIEIRNKKAVFRKKGCISCFCCQEMCPMKAIYVKKRL